MNLHIKKRYLFGIRLYKRYYNHNTRVTKRTYQVLKKIQNNKIKYEKEKYKKWNMIF